MGLPIANLMTRMTRRLFVSALCTAPYALSRSWDDQAFSSWTPEFVDRLLTDSPWSRQSTVAFELEPVQRLQSSDYAQIGLPGGIGFPGGGIPGTRWPSGGSRTGSQSPTWPGGGASSVRTEIYLTTRWSSALPIRRGLAIQEFGAGGLENEKALELLNAEQTEYVIEIAGFPTTIIRQGAKKFAAELLKSARVVVPGRAPLRATSSYVPEYGMHLVATLRFPRFDDLDSKDGTIEVNAQSGNMNIRERFKLKDMMYGGKLEL
jgi:hypothetical protein